MTKSKIFYFVSKHIKKSVLLNLRGEIVNFKEQASKSIETEKIYFKDFVNLFCLYMVTFAFLQKKTLLFSVFYRFCPQMLKKQKNHNLVAYFEKYEKNVKILQILCQFFDFFFALFF